MTAKKKGAPKKAAAKKKKSTKKQTIPVPLDVTFPSLRVDHAGVKAAIDRIREAAADLLQAARIESVDVMLHIYERYGDNEHEIDVSMAPAGSGWIAKMLADEHENDAG